MNEARFLLLLLQYALPGFETMPLLEALNGYRLSLPAVAEEGRNKASQPGEAGKPKREEGEGGGGTTSISAK